jgi:hypothetical protein
MVIKESSMVNNPAIMTSPAAVNMVAVGSTTTSSVREESPKHRSFKEKVKGIFHHHHHD